MATCPFNEKIDYVKRCEREEHLIDFHAYNVNGMIFLFGVEFGVVRLSGSWARRDTVEYFETATNAEGS